MSHSLISTPWALAPGIYDALAGWYAARLEARAADGAPLQAQALASAASAVAAVSGRAPTMAQEDQYVLTPGGTALITLSGVLMPKAPGMANLCNPGAASSAALLAEQLDQAAADGKARAALLYIDSPGGNVLGIAEAAAALQRLSQAKPTAVLSDGQICSAAYWIGSAAPRLYITGPMVQVGSVGVRMEMIDTTGADAKAGIQRKTLTFGRYKARGGSGGGGDVAAYDDHQQAQVDYMGSLFADAVAAHRGLALDRVLSDIATGQVFVGQQAIDAGLVDGVMSLPDLIAALESDPASVTTVPGAARGTPKGTGNPASTPAQKGPRAMTPDEIKAQYPDAYSAIHTAGLTAGAEGERARIQAVRAAALPGHEVLIDTMAFDGKTTGGEAALAVLAAERERISAQAKAHFAAGIKPLPVSAGSAEADRQVVNQAQDKGAAGRAALAAVDRAKAMAGI